MSLLDNPTAPAPSRPERPAPRRASTPSRAVHALRNTPVSLIIGIAVIVAITVILVLTPWIMPYNPSAQNLSDRLAPSSSSHWLGTDQLGRDVLSRLMDGGRFSVSIAAITLAICAVSGTLIGIVCARRRGALDQFVMRVTDVLLAFPEMIVAMFLVSILGAGYTTLILALVIGGWTPFARLARGLTLEIDSRDFIEAARALGCSSTFIVFRHILPNALSPLTAHAALRFGHKLITVGALSFLGLGVQPPDADWGSMLADAQPFMSAAPGLVIYPGLAIFITALSVTLIGQGINARRSRQS
ncbi:MULTISPECIES: ABC transporter permease [Rhodococcus]|uniref:Putative ABC transporter permease protein n=2 Tax=Rhodococcus opacus TaxID=37919 RepID=C1BD64_RHOOB|nr:MULTISPECIES: ABC transporter permease [Rhodococcus]EID81275.1 putative ABC transporter permease protein [Rhodococcus opacus RKJ300 = JCM 13270]KAF0957076.1 Glutathione transport system permease protein GsiD [Rhodococcus sp. T7]KAF0959822.1 Glutathione transport system permease protein GsiD [Rhodococcus sp. T7]QQZ19283.1 ABC transporter permease [Rhodococcus sp. 21391]UOT08058.1 ABC transporter permease [Rhodococcus opacus]